MMQQAQPEPCIVTRCQNPAFHNIGIRLRRPSTRAIWAPNTDAFVCDVHAVQGFRIEITLTPTATGQIETEVRSQPGRLTIRRTTQIVRRAWD